MFENLQDTSLLRDSLASSFTISNSENETIESKEFDLKYSKEIVLSVSCSIQSICSNKLNLSNVELNVSSERCHAVVFLSLLKSCDISCEESTVYYKSVYYTYPTLDFKTYLHLTFNHDWSTFFARCTTQLSTRVLSSIIEKILQVEWNSPEEDLLMCHSYHMVIQSVIWKVFFAEEHIMFFTVQNNCRFDFPYVCLSSRSENNVEISSKLDDHEKLLDMYQKVLNRLKCFISLDVYRNIQIFKVLLHAYKSIFRLLIELQNYSSSILSLFSVNEIFNTVCFKDGILTEAGSDQIKLEYSPSWKDSLCNQASWFVDVNYLLFIVHNFWDDFSLFATKTDDIKCLSLGSNLPSAKTKRKLMELSPIFNKNFEENDNAQELLKKIVSKRHLYYSRAASVLLWHPEVRVKEEFIKIFEKQASSLCASEVYRALADAIVKTEMPEIKIKYLNIFYQTWCEASDDTFNEIFTYILKEYGSTDNFKLPDYDNQLTQFVRKTMLLQEGKLDLLKLLLQRPKVTIKTIIEQSLIRGPDGMSLLQIFNCIPVVCIHEDSLVTELSNYFTKEELEVHESKNLLSLIKILIEMHVQRDIMSFDLYLKLCFFSSSSHCNHNKLKLSLECLNASLEGLTTKQDLKISLKTCSSLLKYLFSLIHASVLCGFGKIKELAITALFLLHKIEKGALNNFPQAELASFGQVTQIYIWKQFCDKSYRDLKGTSKTLCPELLVWCCYMKDFETLEKCISHNKTSYKDLINILIPLVSHFTKEEWAELPRLLEIVLSQQTDSREYCYDFPWLLPRVDTKLYAVARCLMDSYFSAAAQIPGDVQYMTSSFTRTLAALLSDRAQPHLLAHVYTDVCHLLSVCNEEVRPALSAFLMTIAKSSADGSAPHSMLMARASTLAGL